jgi:hypothetical protein
MRPEAERRLPEGFQRRVNEQGSRCATRLEQARRQAARFECGEVAGVFTAQAGGGVLARTYVVGLAPLAAIPVLIAAAALGMPGTLPLLGAFPFLAGAWIGISFWRGREPRRQVWLYAFTMGFMLLEDPAADTAPVPWSQVTEVAPVWANTYRPGDEDPRPTLTAYRLRTADGQVHEISRSFRRPGRTRAGHPSAARARVAMYPGMTTVTSPSAKTAASVRWHQSRACPAPQAPRAMAYSTLVSLSM